MRKIIASISRLGFALMAKCIYSESFDKVESLSIVPIKSVNYSLGNKYDILQKTLKSS